MPLPTKLRKTAAKIVTGVYCIRNRINGKVYIGGAYVSFSARFKGHRNCLKGGRHGNQHLQNAWNKYGPAAFTFKIIERCSTKICARRETYWIARFKATEREFGYNKSPTGGSPLGTKHSLEYRMAVAERGRNMSPETRAKIGAASRGRKCSKAARKKISENSKKMWQNPGFRAKVVAAIKKRWSDEEFKLRMSGLFTGKVRPEITCKRISRALKGRKLSPEHREKARIANLGKKRSPEAIAKFSAKMKGRKRPRSVVLKIAKANRGKKRSAEARANIALGQQRRYQDPDQRAKMAYWKGKKMSDAHKAKISASQCKPEVRKRKSEAAKAQWRRIKEVSNAKVG